MNWSNAQKTIILIVAVVGVLSLALAAWGVAAWGFARAKASDKPGNIAVSGSAEVTAVPDVACVSLGVVTRDPKAEVAAKSNADRTARVIEAVRKHGVEQRDIKTSHYSLQREVDYDSSPPKFLGYKASSQIRVETKDIAGVGKLIDAAVAAGANSVNGVSFDVENKSALRDKALSLASKRAREKANAMATALGVRLGRPVWASDSVSTYYNRNVVFDVSPMSPEPRASTPIAPGETTISADVTLKYAMK